MINCSSISSRCRNIYRKISGSGCRHSSSIVIRPLLRDALHNTTLIISYDKMKNVIEIVKYLKDSGLLLKGVSEKIQNEAKEQKGGFLSKLLGTLDASLLGNIIEL